MSRANALANLERRLLDGLAKKGNEHHQRQTTNLMMVEASKAGEPILEWLEQYFTAKALAQPAPDPAPLPVVTEPGKELFKCPDCEREFSSHHALCGHRRTHSKQATGLVDGLD